MAQHLYTYVNPVHEKHMDTIRGVLENGGVIAYPTDVNWAIGCDASNARAVERIHRLKPTHPKDRPFSLICADISMASEIVQIDTETYRHLRRALPGPYTVLLTASRTLPRQIHDKRRVVGLRVPDHELLLEIVRRFGKPLATTSVPAVPRLGEDGVESPAFGWQVMEHFGHGLDIVVDLGDEVPHGESTIVDMTQPVPLLVRRGMGDPDVFVGIEEMPPSVDTDEDSDEG